MQHFSCQNFPHGTQETCKANQSDFYDHEIQSIMGATREISYTDINTDADVTTAYLQKFNKSYQTCYNENQI